MKQNQNTTKGNEQMAKNRYEAGAAAVSPVIGFVLIIAISTVALTIVQVTAVPVWNENAEFDHSQTVLNDMQELRSESLRVASTGRVSATDIGLGTAYPRRPPLLNPPSATGTLSTGDKEFFVLENVVATDEETADYWNGSAKEFPTTSVVYKPDYNVLNDENRFVYESAGSVVYNDARNGQATLTDTLVVSGRRITLVSLDGSLSRAGSDTYTLDLEPVSAPHRTVAVKNGSENIVVTVPTGMSEERWDDILSDQVGNDGYIADYSVSDGELTVELVSEVDDEVVVYDLRMAKVGVGSGFEEEGAYYVKAPEGTEPEAPLGSPVPLVVEVRDRYNNPVSGVKVGFDADGGALSAQTALTGENGEASVTFTTTTPTVVRASIAGREAAPEFDARTKEDVKFDVSLADGSGGSGDSEDTDINPNYLGTLVLERASIEACSSGPGQGQGQGTDCRSTMEFTNTNAGDLTVESARINFFSASTAGLPPGLQRSPPTRGVLGGTSLGVGDAYSPVNIGFSPGTSEISMDFYESGSDEYDLKGGDFYVLTFIFDDDTVGRYFVYPTA